MKKTILLTLVLLTALVPVKADEGMWLPLLISSRIDDMQAKGFKLTAEDIYSVNKASLKDAVVRFGGGCTGEVVSPDGLLFTNHHCGYGQIQEHSTVEHDYLKDGFWAMSKEEELPNPGLTVSFLQSMEDVTDRVLKGYVPTMTNGQRDSVIQVNSRVITEAINNQAKGIRSSVEGLYNGNQYFLFVYKIYSDVRLVGAPPSSIGKFGGDTDNWMWPRHTGDFSIFRIYANKDNEPAEYSKDNVPYHPKRYFTISRKGVKEGDFTMVYGTPGTTREYVTSDEVRYTGEISDPEKIALRTMRLDIQKKYMSQDQAVRIQYSSKNASVSNAWKKWQGEAKGLARRKTVESKLDFEKKFREWAEKNQYKGLLEQITSLYERRNPYFRAQEYYNETVSTIELLSFANRIYSALQDGRPVAPVADDFYKDYYQPIDEEIFVAMMGAFDKQLSADFKPAYHTQKLAQFGSLEAWRNDVFARSIFTDKGKVLRLTKDDLSKIKSDPAYEMYEAYNQWYRKDLQPTVSRLGQEISLANRRYMKAQMEFQPDKTFYPDANRTLRVSYGQVAGYKPSDAIYYSPISTLKGIIEKDNPEIFDYNIPQTLRDIYAEGGHDDQPVCFLATNHTSGGNSGSPVLNGNGELIGINFDRVWEGTMSDLAFDPEFCRNISLDIRYLLFVVEKIGHAQWLLKEMTFAD